MADISYPQVLRGAIQQGKQRNLAKTYINAEPLTGPFYIQKITDEAPVIWDFDLVFNEYDAQYFDAWFLLTTEQGTLPFNMPIRTEQGLVDHELKFVEIPNGARESGNTWSYSCTVQAREIVRPVSARDIIDFREGGFTQEDQLLLDTIVNEDWAQARQTMTYNGDTMTYNGDTMTYSRFV